MLIRRIVIRALGLVVAVVAGWGLRDCVHDQQAAVKKATEDWTNVRARTQRYFDSQDAFAAEMLGFLQQLDDRSVTASRAVTEGGQLITEVGGLGTQCRDAATARLEFQNAWNELTARFGKPAAEFPDEAGQCTHWGLFVTDLKSVDWARLVRDAHYAAAFHANDWQVIAAGKTLAKERAAEMDLARRTASIFVEIDHRTLMQNCWLCVKMAVGQRRYQRPSARLVVGVTAR
jgi:hypothetical protein